MSDMAALERRYRRMLAWFPAEHRRIYGEEMIGVLLASASDDRDRPSLADTIDIAVGGLRTRLRRWVGAEHIDSEWSDALAAFSVAAPVLMIAYLASHLYVLLRFEGIVNRIARFDRYFPLRFDVTVQLTAILLMIAATVTAIAALAICPALVRQRRRLAVAVVAAVPALLGAAATVYIDRLGFFGIDVGFTALFVTEIAAVVIAPDPGRGWRVLKRRGLIIVVAVGLLTLAAEWLLQNGALGYVNFNRIAVEVALLALGIALVLIFGSSAHKRMLALLAIPGYPILVYVQVYSVLFNRADSNTSMQGLYLPTLAIGVLVGLAIWQASRHTAPGVTSG